MSARDIEGFCTDCATWTPLHDGRCGCGSGRVAVPPAGFRILGPDEVDPVTVEKCAAHLEGHGTVFMRDAAAAIRALGRKA